MKKAPPVTLSLRKLFLAMLAVGPLAILPAPVWATLPGNLTAITSTPLSQPNTVIQTSGSGSLSPTPASGTTATLSLTDKSVLVWTTGAFNIGVGEQLTFLVPSGGSVLNKVGYNTNQSTASADNAIINGTLTSTGRVFILANGNILVGAGANITAPGGLVLSTVQESSDFPFTTGGNLSFSGASSGSISLGNGTNSGAAAVTVSGNIGVWSGAISINNVTVSGDMILNQSSSALAGTGLALTAATGPTNVNNGNLTVTTNAGPITQAGTALKVTNGVTTLNTGGNAAITLTTLSNDFNTVQISAGTGVGGSASITDLNSVILGASTVGQDLTVIAGAGNITTSGTLAVTGVASLTATGGNIAFANNSSAAAFAASATGGSVIFNGVGNVETRAITASATGVSVTTTGTATINGVIATTGNVAFSGTTIGAGLAGSIGSGGVNQVGIASGGAGYTSVPTVTFAVQTGATLPTATAALGIGAINLSGSGAGYTATPTVTLTGGGGSGATATAVLTSGVVTAVNVTAAGTGYTSVPTIGFSTSGSTTAATAVANAKIVSITSTASGSGYTATPTVGLSTSGATTPANLGALLSDPTANIASVTATAGSAVLPAVFANTLNIVSTGGSISQNTGNVPIVLGTAGGATGTLNASAGTTGTIALTNNNVMTNTSITLAGGNVSLTNTRNLTLASTNTTGSLTINTTPATEGTAGTTRNGTVTIGVGSGTNATALTVGGALNISTNAAIVTDDTYVSQFVSGAVTVNTATGTAAADLAGASVSLNAAAANPAGTSTGRFGQFTVNAGTAAVTLSENTTMNLGNITSGAFVARTLSAGADILINGQLTSTTATLNTSSSAANITESASGNIAWTGAATLNVSGNGSAFLPTQTNSFGGVVTLVNGLNTNIVAGSNISFATNNSVIANSNITVQTVGATNNTATFGASGTSNALAVTINSAGPIIVGGSTLTVTRLTLISASTAANSISQGGPFTQMNGTLTVTSSGNVLLSNVGNNITGSVVLSNQVGDAAVYSARNLTISGSSAGNLTAVAGTAVAGTSTGTFSNTWNLILGNLNVKGLTAGSANGNTTIAPLGAATITNGGAGYTSAPVVTISGGGGIGATATATFAGGLVTGVTITNAGAGYVSPPTVTFSNTNASNVNVATATIALTSLNGNAAGGNAIAGISGNISQVANANLHVENTVDLVTYGGNVQLANNGNSFGRVQASTGGAAGIPGVSNINIVEDSTLKVGSVWTLGNASLTSRFGSIIEDPIAAVNITVNGASSVFTATANAGSILLGNADHTNATTTGGNIIAANVTTSGAAKLISSGNITLGASSANSLTVTSANVISQSAPLSIFGGASFTTTGGVGVVGDVQLTNAGNNFGPVSVTTGVASANVAITEGGTLNLRSVSMLASSNGTFTATSANGDIIDTGLGGVKPGGTTASPGSGVVTLSAVNGNIEINDPTSDFQTNGGVLFNAKNVTLAVLGGSSTTPITLALGAASGASVATGNLTVQSILGDVVQLGPLSVTGNASFQTGTKNISLFTATNSFGSLKFIGNTVNIQQIGDMKVLTGSSATGAAALTSNGGGITIVQDPAGSLVTFGSTASFAATTNITLPKLLQAVGTLNVSAAGTKDLSKLSITGDLNNKTPTNGGTGAYLPPNP